MAEDEQFNYTGTVLGVLTERRRSENRIQFWWCIVDLVLICVIPFLMDWSTEPTVTIGGSGQRMVNEIRFADIAPKNTTDSKDSGAVLLNVPQGSRQDSTGDTTQVTRELEGLFAFGVTFDELIKRKPILVTIPAPLGDTDDTDIDIPVDEIGTVPSYSPIPGSDTAIRLIENLTQVELPPPTDTPRYDPRPVGGVHIYIPRELYPTTALSEKQWGVVRLLIKVDSTGHCMLFEADVPVQGNPDNLERRMVEYVIVLEYPETWFFADFAGPYVFNHWIFTPAMNEYGRLVADTTTASVYFKVRKSPTPEWWWKYREPDSP